MSPTAPSEAAPAPVPGSLADCDAVAATPNLAWALPITANAFSELASEVLADLPGGRRGFLVLATVSRGLPRSQLALAQQLGVDKNAMTSLLDGLEAAGLLERRPDPADRRARQLFVTAAGTCALEALENALRVAADQLLSSLTAEEAATFSSLLERVARAVQSGPGAPSVEEACASDSPC